MTYQFVSPDLRYVARGAASNNDPLPFKLKDNTTGQFVREFDWVRGKVFFTADSSRVLVAEGQGRYRWFKLPSGELEKEWTLEPVDFNKPGVKGLGVISMSADGSVLVYDGELVGHAGAYHVIDGRTGKVTRSLSGYAPQFGTASADSGLAVLAKRGADGKLRTADVINLATGKVLAELPAPAGSDSIIPTVLPDGSGVLAHVGPNKVVRIDFVVPGKRTPPP
jgi:hypothetical protein